MKKIPQTNHRRIHIAVNQLTVGWKDAQRSAAVVEAHVANIVANYDPDKLGTIVVAPLPNGTYHIIDGRHRIEALKRLGYGELGVLCEVHDVDKAKAADTFIGLSTTRKMQAVDSFRVSVTAGYEKEVAVSAIIRKHGYNVSMGSNDGDLSAVAACIRVYEHDGPEALDMALAIIKGAWGLDRNAVHQTIIRGVGLVCGTFNGQLDVERMKERLSKDLIPGTIPAKARALQEQGGSLSLNVARVLLGSYNHGMKSKRLSLRD